jgi:hypothetical protein
MPKAQQATPMAVRAFARWLGVTPAAVRRAANDGRLVRSVARDAKGRLLILDAALARREWEAHSRPWIGYNSKRSGQ